MSRSVPSGEFSIAAAVRQLAELDAACIDASSMIVCNKAGILDDLGACCTLYSVPEVLAETGYDDAPVTLSLPDDAPVTLSLPADAPVTLAQTSAQTSAQPLAPPTDLQPGNRPPADLLSTELAPDDRLLYAALRARLPLISEDRELLLRFGESGLPYFNALMMLEYLLLRGRLSSRDYPQAARRLRRASRYNAEVLAFAHDVHLEVLKRR